MNDASSSAQLVVPSTETVTTPEGTDTITETVVSNNTETVTTPVGTETIIDTVISNQSETQSFPVVTITVTHNLTEIITMFNTSLPTDIDTNQAPLTMFPIFTIFIVIGIIRSKRKRQ